MSDALDKIDKALLKVNKEIKKIKEFENSLYDEDDTPKEIERKSNLIGIVLFLIIVIIYAAIRYVYGLITGEIKW